MYIQQIKNLNQIKAYFLKMSSAVMPVKIFTFSIHTAHIVMILTKIQIFLYKIARF